MVVWLCAEGFLVLRLSIRLFRRFFSDVVDFDIRFDTQGFEVWSRFGKREFSNLEGKVTYWVLCSIT